MKNILSGTIMPKSLFFFEDEGGGSGNDTPPEKPKNLSEFAARFSAKRVNPTLVGEPPSKEQIEDHKKNHAIVDDSKDDDSDLSDEEKAEKARIAQEQLNQQNAAKKRGGSNVPKIVEDKRKAESERDAIKGEYEKYKTETEAKIAKFQEQIDGGKLSEAKEQEFQKKITQMEGDLQTAREEADAEVKRLKSRLSLYDIQEDETFKKNYVAPAIEAFNRAASAIGADDKNSELLSNAMIANSAALNAKTPQAKQQAERQRDAILSQIEEAMPGFTGKRFSAAMGDYIIATERHAEALKEHGQTAERIKQQRKEEQTKSFSKTLETWGKAFDAETSAYDEEAKLSKEEMDIAKELGLKVEDDLAEGKVKAKKALTGQAEVQDSVRLLQRGRIYPALVAKTKVQAKEIENLKSLIAKLRSSGTGGGGGGGGNGADKKQTREEFHKRFSPNREGLVKPE